MPCVCLWGCILCIVHFASFKSVQSCLFFLHCSWCSLWFILCHLFNDYVFSVFYIVHSCLNFPNLPKINHIVWECTCFLCLTIRNHRNWRLFSEHIILLTPFWKGELPKEKCFLSIHYNSVRCIIQLLVWSKINCVVKKSLLTCPMIHSVIACKSDTSLWGSIIGPLGRRKNVSMSYWFHILSASWVTEASLFQPQPRLG